MTTSSDDDHQAAIDDELKSWWNWWNWDQILMTSSDDDLSLVSSDPHFDRRDQIFMKLSADPHDDGVSDRRYPLSQFEQWSMDLQVSLSLSLYDLRCLLAVSGTVLTVFGESKDLTRVEHGLTMSDTCRARVRVHFSLASYSINYQQILVLHLI